MCSVCAHAGEEKKTQNHPAPKRNSEDFSVIKAPLKKNTQNHQAPKRSSEDFGVKKAPLRKHPKPPGTKKVQ